MLHALEDRVMGVLLGLAAGDRIGGPARMALRVVESLLDCRGFDSDDIARRYLAWWHEAGFDAGPTAARVLSLAASGVPLEQAALRVDAEAGGMTAGCDPAHLSARLAMLAGLEESRLEAAAIAEARLTHRHPLAGEVAAVVVGLCRALILGASWPAALDRVLANRDPAIACEVEIRTAETPSNDGFAPEAPRAALYFVNRSDSFSTALKDSIQFAGTANYCPVLVGSIGGARWGWVLAGFVVRDQAPLPPAVVADRIVVHKAERELLLVADEKTLKRYRIALGGHPQGHKTQEGDRRTPEGAYRIAGRNPRSAYHLSLRISHPNEEDRIQAARRGVSPGGDIMIHGLPNGFGWVGRLHQWVDWTAGCIAVTDSEIEEIWRSVPDGTPVEIKPCAAWKAS